jgi:hypothetical protein
MKTNSKTMLRAMLALSALLVCGSGAASQAAAPKSPVGTWDCIISGSRQQGIAFLTFSNNITGTNGIFTGYRLLVGAPDPTTPGANPRGDNTEIGRGPDSGTNGFSGTNLFGFDRVHGQWQYDEKGRVIGRFEQVTGGGVTTCTTNQNISTVTGTTTVFVTNGDVVTFYVTNTTFYITNAPTITCVTSSDTTNGVSFNANVQPGKSLNLVSSTANGKVTYNGRPYTSQLLDLTGNWYATKEENNQSFLEFFGLTKFSTGNPSGFPDDITNYSNIYFSLDGTGPTYDFSAISMLSKRGKIGFSFYTGSSSNSTVSATLGSFSHSNSKNVTKANTKGFDQDQAPPATIKVKAVLQP